MRRTRRAGMAPGPKRQGLSGRLTRLFQPWPLRQGEAWPLYRVCPHMVCLVPAAGDAVASKLRRGDRIRGAQPAICLKGSTVEAVTWSRSRSIKS